MRDPVLAEHAQRLEDRDETRLVVPAQDRRAVRPDHVAAHDRLHVLARHHRVHVGAEEERRGAGGGPRELREEVPRLAADFLPRVVLLDGCAQPREGLPEALGDPALALGQGVDPDELQELRDEARAIDHGVSLKHRWNHSMLPGSPGGAGPPRASARSCASRARAGTACQCRGAPRPPPGPRDRPARSTSRPGSRRHARRRRGGRRSRPGSSRAGRNVRRDAHARRGIPAPRGRRRSACRPSSRPRGPWTPRIRGSRTAPARAPPGEAQHRAAGTCRCPSRLRGRGTR